jgi:hypothetical protein
MKKKLLIAFSVLVLSLLSAMDLHAQGTIKFQNSLSFPVVTNNPTGGTGRAIGSTYHVALYWAPLGSSEPDLMQIGSAISGTTLNGFFNGGTYTTPTDTAPGDDAMFEVKGWTGNYGTYEDALASGDPDVLVGVSGMWQNHTGGAGVPPTPPSLFTFGLGGFEGLLLDTP